MLIKTLPVGYLETNCYIVSDEETLECAIIDPGADSGAILDYVESNRLTPKIVFLTHGHFDHILALGAVLDETGADAYINEKDSDLNGKGHMNSAAESGRLHWYYEGDTFKVGGLEFLVMETPGHSPGSVTLKCGAALFTGDTLFRDSCGRTDLEGGDMEILLKSLLRLSRLEGDYEVYPGHAESSTLDRERGVNYYIRYAVSGKTP